MKDKPNRFIRPLCPNEWFVLVHEPIRLPPGWKLVAVRASENGLSCDVRHEAHSRTIFDVGLVEQDDDYFRLAQPLK